MLQQNAHKIPTVNHISFATFLHFLCQFALVEAKEDNKKNKEKLCAVRKFHCMSFLAIRDIERRNVSLISHRNFIYNLVFPLDLIGILFSVKMASLQ